MTALTRIPCSAASMAAHRDGFFLFVPEGVELAGPIVAINWLRRHGNPYTAVGADADARVSLEWGVTGVPETFIVDANGIIVYKHVGPVTQDTLENRIMPKLREAERG